MDGILANFGGLLNHGNYLSTEIATAYFTDQIRKAMDNAHYVGAVYIDLSKALTLSAILL